MKQFPAKNIRNVALAGHGSAGKTSLAEAMIYLTGGSDRLGKVSDGNTVLDFDSEEIKRKTSIMTAVAPIEWKNEKINLIDTPGLFDYEGSVWEGLRAAESTLIAISGKSGVTVGAQKAYQAATKRGLSKLFFVGKLDSENADFYKVFEGLKSEFGPVVCPMVVPYVVDRKVQCYISLLEYKAYTYQNGKASEVPIPDLGARLDGLRTAMNEAVAETSDELFEKYFSGQQFTPEELIMGLSKGVKSGTIAPVFCGSAANLEAIDLLLNGLSWLAPDAESSAAEIAADANGNPVELMVNPDGMTAAVVFKTVADPFVGKLSYFKVVSGKVSSDSQLLNTTTGATERIGKVLFLKGKKQEDAGFVGAGDIGAVAKLQSTFTGNTLCSPARVVTLDGVDYPRSCLSMAIIPQNKGDEEKITQGLGRLMEEDPTLKLENNTETHQMILSGLGEQHLDVAVSKLKNRYSVGADLVTPRVPYRETIRKKVRVQGRHKKQTGGHGQFGDVWIEFEPCDSDDLIFEEKVVGGAVPKGFFPAVEKGLRDCIQHGTLAGYPMVGLKATLVDGSYHPVDSSEMSFKMAATLAYRSGIPTAGPVLLEPIGSLKVLVPDDNMGDIIGEINKRRGRVLGMDAVQGGYQEISAEVPMAEMSDFTTFLRSTSQGRGSFELEFERYEDAPPNVAQKVIEASKEERGDAE